MILVSLFFSLTACKTEEEPKNDSTPTPDDSGGEDSTSDDSGPDDSGPVDTGPDDTAPPAGDAQVRVLHLSPDAPGVDVLVNGGSAAVSDLQFPNGTGYLTVPAGVYTFDVVPTGGSVGDSVLKFADVNLEDGKAYTAVAYGRVASIAGMALVDDASGLASDRVRLTVAHAASAVGEVDIWDLTGSMPSLLLENVPFGAAATLPDLPVGALRVGLDVNNDAVPDVTFAVPELPGGTYANVFAVSDANDQPFLLAQLPDGGTARIDPELPQPDPSFIRVLHLSPDAPAVDLFVNSDPVAALTGLPFLSGTGYLEVPAGIYTFDIAPEGAGIGSAVLSVPGLMLDSNIRYSAVAYGRVANLTALALVDDMVGLAADQIRVQVAHTASAVGEVDIWEVNLGVPLLENVGYGASAVLPDLPAGSYRVGLDVDNNAIADVTFTLPELAGGTFVNVFAVTDSSDTPWLVAWLPDGTVVPIAAD